MEPCHPMGYKFVNISYVRLLYNHTETLSEWLKKNVGLRWIHWDSELERSCCQSTVFSFKDAKHKRQFDLVAQLTGCVAWDTLEEYTTWYKNNARSPHS